MRSAVGTSLHPRFDAAVDEACDAVRAGLRGTAPDVVFALFTASHGAHVGALHAQLRERLGTERLIGGAALGVVVDGAMVSERPALSLLAVAVPGARVRTWWCADGARASLPVRPDDAVLTLADPAWPLAPELPARVLRAGARSVAGGLVMTSARGGPALLVHDGDVRAHGAVGVSLHGDVTLDAFVSQSCRPVGPAHTVTSVAGHRAVALDDEPALSVLHRDWEALDPELSARARRVPLVGVSGPRDDDGAWFARPVRDVDPRAMSAMVDPSLAVGDRVRVLVLDGLDAGQRLAAGLRGLVPAGTGLDGGAVVQFTSTTRTGALFAGQDLDAAVAATVLPGAPLWGATTAGEIAATTLGARLHAGAGVTAVLRPIVWN
ncbi:MAG: hypothetical protein H6733_12405 [Alphaproteobacteria bacterium]|nr:hypothetical protein [Alphaproteobacteria bacterium]